jgi:hypothetical protein
VKLGHLEFFSGLGKALVGTMETGRPSVTNFQSMNFASTRQLNGVGPRMDVYDRTLIASLVRTHAVVF